MIHFDLGKVIKLNRGWRHQKKEKSLIDEFKLSKKHNKTWSVGLVVSLLVSYGRGRLFESILGRFALKRVRLPVSGVFTRRLLLRLHVLFSFWYVKQVVFMLLGSLPCSLPDNPMFARSSLPVPVVVVLVVFRSS